MFDPEGFGEIPLDDFEQALDSREFITNISPGKIIMLKDRLLAHRQIGVSAVTFQEFVNTLSGKRSLSFKCAVHAKDKQVRRFFNMTIDIFAISFLLFLSWHLQ